MKIINENRESERKNNNYIRGDNNAGLILVEWSLSYIFDFKQIFQTMSRNI